MQYIKTEIKNNIIEAAKIEFLEKGYNEASIRNIVKNSKVSLGNLYRYFKNKEELYNAVLEPVINKCFENTKTLVFKEEYFEIISQYMAKFYLDYEDVILILQKGDYVTYSNFLNNFASIISEKIKSSQAIDNKIIDILSISFVNGLKTIMENYKDSKIAEKEICILLNVIFKNIKNRI